MITLLKQNKLLSIIIAIFIIGLLYYAFFSDKSSTSPALTTSDTLAPSAQSQQLLLVLANLRTIQLNNAVFSDPVFVSLNDFGVTIPPQAVSRHNPFLPAKGQPHGSSTSIISTRTLQSGH